MLHLIALLPANKYDARLLLDSLPHIDTPSRTVSTQSIPGSPSGWSDLPSDAEDTFFFSPEEADDFRNEKRRRLFEQAQEERLKARMEEEKGAMQEEVDEDPWGDSDEEPDDAQKELMRRTAAHLFSSPNPAQLEMRILANHGADKRFAFLKGRWSHAWLVTKAKLRVEKEVNERKEKEEKRKGLNMLAGYDSASDDAGDEAAEGVQNSAREDEEKANESVDIDEMKKELRRQKAKEWAERRRAQANVAGTEE